MKNPAINSATFDFLNSLHKNNNREWFNNHKDQYQAALSNMTLFADELIALMNKHDQIETASGKESLYRIYNDMRFAKDKKPYKTHFAGSLARFKPRLRGGYYFHIGPGDSFLGVGFFSPSPEDLKTIRTDIAYNYGDWKKLLSNKGIQKVYGKLQGDALLTAPKGFDKDHPAIELLRLKQFLFMKKFSNTEVLAPDFVKKVNESFKAIRPFFDHMSMVLTTDANGISRY